MSICLICCGGLISIPTFWSNHYLTYHRFENHTLKCWTCRHRCQIKLQNYRREAPSEEWPFGWRQSCQQFLQRVCQCCSYRSVDTIQIIGTIPYSKESLALLFPVARVWRLCLMSIQCASYREPLHCKGVNSVRIVPYWQIFDIASEQSCMQRPQNWNIQRPRNGK